MILYNYQNTINKFLLIIAPLFFLIIKGWINVVLFILFINSLCYLYFEKKKLNKFYDKSLIISIVVLFLPFCGIFITQTLRNDYFLQNYDPFLRLIFFSLIFISVVRGWLCVGTTSITEYWARFSLPLSAIFTVSTYIFWVNNWGSGRLTTYFVDPLTFASFGILFLIISIYSYIFYYQKSSKIEKFIQILGSLSGLIIAVSSGSRTGWLDIPLFLITLSIYYLNKNKGSLKTFCFCFGFLFIICITVYLNELLYNKFMLMITQLINYKWNSMNDDGSVTLRINYLRNSLYYFSEQPFQGWGDLGWKNIMNSNELTFYSSFYSRQFAEHGFHNEILTNMVRSGIFGLCSSISIIFYPIFFSVFFLRNSCDFGKSLLLFCIIVSSQRFVTSMSTEIYNLTYLASINSILIFIPIAEYLHYKYISQK